MTQSKLARRRVDLKSQSQQVKTLELRLEGMSITEIAYELGLAPSTVSIYIKEALEQVRFERAEKAAELRDLITMRNDLLIQSILPQALGGDLYAVDRVIKLQEQQAKLNGAEVRTEKQDEEWTEKPMVLLPSVLNDEEVAAGPAEQPLTIVGQASRVETDDEAEPVYEEVELA